MLYKIECMKREGWGGLWREAPLKGGRLDVRRREEEREQRKRRGEKGRAEIERDPER